jgi:hypothetical protein
MIEALDLVLVGLAIALGAVLLKILFSRPAGRLRNRGPNPPMSFGLPGRRWASMGNLISLVVIFGLIGVALFLPPKSKFSFQGGCLIKGNVSFSDERIYHMPGDRYYEETVIDERYGERWFCSEADARAAGWRHAKV